MTRSASVLVGTIFGAICAFTFFLIGVNTRLEVFSTDPFKSAMVYYTIAVVTTTATNWTMTEASKSSIMIDQLCSVLMSIIFYFITDKGFMSPGWFNADLLKRGWPALILYILFSAEFSARIRVGLLKSIKKE